MEEFDFDEALPPFADDAVKLEHVRLMESYGKIHEMNSKIAEVKMKIAQMEEHAKNVNEQVSNSTLYVRKYGRNEFLF